MSRFIQRRITEPRREGLSTQALWKGDDFGLIVSWEVGRDLAKSDPDLADRAMRGELPILPWKGGVDKPLKGGKKYGTFRYLAMWQGLRGDDLNINLSVETPLTCSRTGTQVIYTFAKEKYATE